MLSITHAAIAVSAASLTFQLGTDNPLALGLALLGSQLPDLDTTTSSIGQICFPLSNWLEDNFPHRTITHSLLATTVLAAIALPIGYYFDHLVTAAVLPFAHAIACFSDTFTKKGVQLFYPVQFWAVAGSNPRRRLKTGGNAEYMVLAIATTILVFSLWINNNGGIFQNLGQNLSLSSTVIETYNENAETNHVYADIEGFWESDRSSADGRYLILGNKGKEFIVTDGEGIYKTGAQIITSKVQTVIGDESENILETLSFDDEQAMDELNSLKNKYPENLIVVSGELTIDLPDEIDEYAKPNTMKTFDVSSNKVSFDNCLLDQVIEVLDGQYAIGSVEVMVVGPVPEI
ncbi:putative membrane-bound metal-dependent hydrolase [Xenococcus sp. PCC 7305]|uniref:metal-dependent hydrolase n=1 Tax=Xenococcus sp. PCC 7305 TaxID=102125 RepID=UPI0002AC3946|nr:metal-dependent hydrolase [Xenococcus sp. PCC 7305]ELS03449.1 putative membrane-bound metal-dependent hydrolase [Xenococcus sp. PCC 7305]